MKPKLLILDRDKVLIEGSNDPESKHYYLLDRKNIKIKDGVCEAIEIIKEWKIPVVLFTKQKCISKGLISRAEVNAINAEIEDLIGIQFDGIYVEEKASLKSELIGEILTYYEGILMNEVLVIDDNPVQLAFPEALGMRTFCTENLLEVIKSIE